jgi:hypothetical protein
MQLITSRFGCVCQMRLYHTFSVCAILHNGFTNRAQTIDQIREINLGGIISPRIRGSLLIFRLCQTIY